jgi:trehalose 6-phosphate phosphatase
LGSDSLPGFQPVTEAGRIGLAALLADPARALIALDFDGTLAPIIEDPTQSKPLPQATSALRALAPLTGTLAIITGRPAAAAVTYGEFDQIPGMIVLGQYGRQRWQAGELTSPPPPPGLAIARDQLPAVLAAARAPAGTWVEDKGHALAVHTRRAADPAGALEQLRVPLLRLAARTGLRAEPGRLVIELRPEGSDKGQALHDLTGERPRSAVLFGGDDLGDRPAFETIRRLQSAGQPAIAVCSRSAEVPELAAEADLAVDGPAGIAALLTALAAAITTPSP